MAQQRNSLVLSPRCRIHTLRTVVVGHACHRGTFVEDLGTEEVGSGTPVAFEDVASWLESLQHYGGRIVLQAKGEGLYVGFIVEEYGHLDIATRCCAPGRCGQRVAPAGSVDNRALQQYRTVVVAGSLVLAIVSF